LNRLDDQSTNLEKNSGTRTNITPTTIIFMMATVMKNSIILQPKKLRKNIPNRLPPTINAALIIAFT